jgi:hypothetical protein
MPAISPYLFLGTGYFFVKYFAFLFGSSDFLRTFAEQLGAIPLFA